MAGFWLVLRGAATISEWLVVGRPHESAETSCLPAWALLWFLLVALLGKPSVSHGSEGWVTGAVPTPITHFLVFSDLLSKPMGLGTTLATCT